jgi:hypothetical protein
MVTKIRWAALMLAAAVAACLLGRLAAKAWAAPWLGVCPALQDAPRLQSDQRQRDLGLVAQGAVLRTTFTVANHGRRRLILLQRGKACCGQETPSRRLVVPPGKSLDVAVEVDTSRWFGRMCDLTEYLTNDPRTPRLTFAVAAFVECALPSPGGPDP